MAMKKIIQRILEVIVILYAAIMVYTILYAILYPLFRDIYTTKPQIETFTYKGHTMIKYTERGSISVCHSPECKKCTTLYD